MKQFISEGRYLANVVGGKLTVYGATELSNRVSGRTFNWTARVQFPYSG